MIKLLGQALPHSLMITLVAAISACSPSPETAPTGEAVVDQVAEAIPQAPAPQIPVYSETEFRRLVAGKSREEIIGRLGRPIAVYDGVSEGAKLYNYSPAMSFEGYVGFRVKDDVTGIEYKFVTVEFDPEGYATGVHF